MGASYRWVYQTRTRSCWWRTTNTGLIRAIRCGGRSEPSGRPRGCRTRYGVRNVAAMACTLAQRPAPPLRYIDVEGFSMHPHRGFDILTYILDGSDGFRPVRKSNQCARPAWRYYLLFWPPRRSARVLGVLALGLFTRTFDFRTASRRRHTRSASSTRRTSSGTT